MVSLIKKTVKGRLYWYAVRSERVNGKPRIVWQQYLGSAEDIAKRLTERPKTETRRFKSMPFGHIAAMAKVNDDIGFVEIIDNNTKKRITGGLSVGQYVLLQLMGRVEGYLSRSAIAEWYPKSIVKLMMRTPHHMNPQNLLRHLDYPTPEAIRAIEENIGKKLIELGLSPSKLIWDTSNFFTQIENGETIPRKGHSKEHRNDRNLIGLGLVVSDENIPFMHETFEANNHDSKVFSEVVDVIVERLKKLNMDSKKVVMILDKGNNSDDNISAVLEKTHIVGSLRYDQADEYLQVPLEEYKPIDSDESQDRILVFRTKGRHYNEDFAIVVSYNPRTYRKQKIKYEETKAKLLDELAVLRDRVERRNGRGRRWTLNRAIRAIVDIIPINMRTVFDYEVKKKVGRGGGLLMTFGINQEKEEARYRSFGKLVLFSDLHEWSSEDIAKAYNDKYQIEDDFKWLKNKLFVPIKPVHVRKDQHIRSHVFICVMGLLFYRYLQWKLRKLGLDYTTDKLDRALSSIRLALISQGNAGKAKFVVEEMDGEQSRLFSALSMADFISV